MEQRQFANGVICIVSPLLASAGIPHGFSTRIGGVSRGAFASLNLGNPMDSAIRDGDANLAENYHRLLAALGLQDKALCRVHQVHGHAVVTVRPGDAPSRHQQADALLSDAPEMALSMRTADCVPILAAVKDGTWVAAVHAGWRGVVAGVLPETISAMHRHGVPASEMLVAVGPCIGPESFEVGEEVADEFRRVFGEAAPITQTPGRKPHVDLSAAVALQARHCGIPPAQVEEARLCTVTQDGLFFSHRRDAGLTGRMAAVIAPKPR